MIAATMIPMSLKASTRPPHSVSIKGYLLWLQSIGGGSLAEGGGRKGLGSGTHPPDDVDSISGLGDLDPLGKAPNRFLSFESLLEEKGFELMLIGDMAAISSLPLMVTR